MRHLTYLLSNLHIRASFKSGNAELDTYLHQVAKQDAKKRVSACFVHTNNQQEVIGYYTLSNSAIPRNMLPESFLKQLPKYKELPVTLLGRLAVDKKHQGTKIGSMLLIDALKRSFELSVTIGSIAVVVDPIDDSAIRFYQKFGFIPLPYSGKMFLPMKTIQQLF